MLKKCASRIYMVLIFAFLYLPIIVLIALSFNDSRSKVKWGGFTLRWYTGCFQDEKIMTAFVTTLQVTFLSAIISTLIGTLAALGIAAMKKRHQTIYLGATNIPLLNADIVTGISMMLLFVKFIDLGFVTVLLAHITFSIPYVILNVLPKMKQTNRSTYEAALDLGATPLYAFYKVTWPEIRPGVFSGFMMAVTMSLDDFVITHFTKGPGVDTLSTKIYSEVRKGIKPEMYALSTLLFVTVLVLLILVNVSPKEDAETAAARKHVRRRSRAGRILVKRVIPVAICLVFVGGGIYYASKGQMLTKEKLIVYNWGEYMDPDVITLFEEETGIDVVYEEFETNEIMYPKISSGAIAYDLVCPSDYMIQRMRENDLLAEINFDNIPNIKNIGKDYLERSKEFDPENKYSVPYCWGTVGILYNKTMVDEPIDSWSVLWDEKYKDNILMQDSVRDAFGVALKYLGYSLNSTDLDELNEAKDLLTRQKPLVQAYVIDQVRDKMIGNEAAIGVIYPVKPSTPSRKTRIWST